MTKTDAIKEDKNENDEIEVYVDEDENEVEYIFGINSGFAYASPSNPIEWIEEHEEFKLV